MKNKNIKIQPTWLPIFTGYYNSLFGDEMERVGEYEAELSEGEYIEYYSELVDAGVTYKFFQENICQYFTFNKESFDEAGQYLCEALLKLDHSNIIKKVEYEKTVSPKYYNFSTDSINCKIEYDVKALKKYVKNNLEKFKEYIEDRYTSRSGFISSYSNDYKHWINELDDLGEHELGSILQFVISNNDDEAELNLYYAANLLEAFCNTREFDADSMIKDFLKIGA